MLPRIAAITIGQSPRPDIIPELRTLIGKPVEIVELGALDALELAAIETLAPGAGEFPLVTRLRNGRSVHLRPAWVEERLQECISQLEGEVELALLLCTGSFRRFRAQKPVLFPGQLLLAITRSVAADKRLGVLTPDPGQQEEQLRRWRQVSPEVIIQPANPYESGKAVELAARQLAGAACALVVMDCLGYTLAMQTLVRQIVQKPVLLARSVLARVAAEMLP